MRTSTIAAALSLLAACAGSSHPRGAAGDPAALYRAKCSACHRAYPPSSRDRASWAEVMARMAPRAHLSAAERDALLGWLQAGASDAPASQEKR